MISRLRDDDSVFENSIKSDFSANFPDSLRYCEEVRKPSSGSDFFIGK
jgi:hypothetical protein